MVTVCEKAKAKATHGTARTRGYDFAINAHDAVALIESGAWGAVMSVATGLNMSDATSNNNAAHDAAHRAAIVARYGE